MKTTKDIAKVEDLAATFEQSQVIMDAVEKAMGDPAGQAALEKARSEEGLNEGWDSYDDLPPDADAYKKAYTKKADQARLGVYAGGGTVAAGAVATITPAALMLLVPALAVSPAIVALGLTAGPALMAIGHIIASKSGEIESSSRVKSVDPRARKPSDFDYQQHKKIRGS